MNEGKIFEQKKIPEMEIREAFANLGINIEKEHPEIFQRLKEMHSQENSHFKDSLEMAKIIKNLWDKLEIQDVSKEKMILSALLHDIGKSGPADASEDEREIIHFLFSKKLPKINREDASEKELTIQEIVENTNHNFDNEKVKKYIESLNLDSNNALHFWRRHAQWTYDILKKNSHGKIDDELIRIASSHHMLEGENPAGISEDEISQGSRALEVIDKYYFLALVDKYQAFRERSQKTHQEAIDILIEMVEKSAHGEESKKHYLQILEKIKNSEDILEK